MSRIGPIVIVEDDKDDQEIMSIILKDLGVKNPQRFFDNCPDALEYLKTTSEKPFLILSDINLPLMTGTEMRRIVNSDEQLRRKSIPFVFLSTSARPQEVEEAYELMVQGFFQKGDKLEELKKSLQLIIDYWKVCRHPNS